MNLWVHSRLVLSLALGAHGWYLGAHPGTWAFGLDDVNLAIPETGHLVFEPFGEWPGVAGGTAFQVLFNIARYASDARAQELPLVGGGEHDWAWMLGELDVLHHERAIGRAVHGAGIVVTMAAVVLGIVLARRAAAEESPLSS